MDQSEFKRPRLSLTRNIPIHNEYTAGIDGEFRDFAFNEERAPQFKGCWRTEVFKVPESTPVDLEIGTGNGKHFQHRSLGSPERCLVGLELKYKPLIQSIHSIIIRNNYWKFTNNFQKADI